MKGIGDDQIGVRSNKETEDLKQPRDSTMSKCFGEKNREEEKPKEQRTTQQPTTTTPNSASCDCAFTRLFSTI